MELIIRIKYTSIVANCLLWVRVWRRCTSNLALRARAGWKSAGQSWRTWPSCDPLSCKSRRTPISADWDTARSARTTCRWHFSWARCRGCRAGRWRSRCWPPRSSAVWGIRNFPQRFHPVWKWWSCPPILPSRGSLRNLSINFSFLFFFKYTYVTKRVVASALGQMAIKRLVWQNRLRRQVKKGCFPEIILHFSLSEHSAVKNICVLIPTSCKRFNRVQI